MRINTKKVTEGAGKVASYELQRILLSGKAFNIFASRSDQKEMRRGIVLDSSPFSLNQHYEKHGRAERRIDT